MANYKAQWQSDDETIDPDNEESHAISVAQMNESLGYVLAWLWAASQDSITRVAIEPITDSRSDIWCTNIYVMYITGVARHIPQANTGGTSNDDIIKGFIIISEKMSEALSTRGTTAEDSKKGKGFSALGDIEGCMLLRASSWYTANEPDEEGNYRNGLVRDKTVDSCIKILESTTHANSHTILW